MNNRGDIIFVKARTDSGVVIPFMMSFLNINKVLNWDLPDTININSIIGSLMDFFGTLLSFECPQIITILTQNNFISNLAPFLTYNNSVIVKKALWIYSNICASTE